METISELAPLRARISAWRAAGERVAFVPTMGNLHAGHLHLVETAQACADRVVVSIFVNPTQFGAGEDLDRYPRTLNEDSAALDGLGTDLLFHPEVETMYPLGQGAVTVQVPALEDLLCGAHRPGHFTGVATVVCMLLNQVQPDVALFGQKDYQQLAVIRRMVSALHLPVEITGVPTVRADDGLALSSRNQYLTDEERRLAPQLYAELCRVAERLKSGDRDFAAMEADAAQALDKLGFSTEYMTVASLDLTVPHIAVQHFVVLVAARLGKARLIDNIEVIVQPEKSDVA